MEKQTTLVKNQYSEDYIMYKNKMDKSRFTYDNPERNK